MRLYSLVENMFAEEEDSPASREAMQKKLHHRGGGVYSSSPDGPGEYKSVDGGQRLEKIPQQPETSPKPTAQPSSTPKPASSPAPAAQSPAPTSQPKTIKNNTFDRNIARLRAIPDDQFPGGHEGKRRAEQRLLKKWDNHLNARAAEKGQDREAQFKDTSDFPGGTEAYKALQARLAAKYGEAPNWDDVSARSEIPDMKGGNTSLSSMIPGYESDPSSSPASASPSSGWPTEPAQAAEPAPAPTAQPASPSPAPSPTPSPSPSASSSPLDKMMQHFGGDTNKVRDTLQKRIDFHSSNPSPDSEAKINAAKELLGQLDPQSSSPAPSAPSPTAPPMMGSMIPTDGQPTANIDPVPTPQADGGLSTSSKATAAAKKHLISSGGDYDAARSQLAKRIAKATTPEEKKKIGEIALALNQIEKGEEDEIKQFADKIQQKQQSNLATSRDKYALARHNPNKGL